MSTPDLNLLLTLHAVLAERSVVGAARRLRLSPSAMSRALTRVREAVGDPVLVKAGRGLVPTPRAMALEADVDRLVTEVVAVLRPASAPDLGTVARTFTLRASEGFAETFGPLLVSQVMAQAPGIRLRFVSRDTRDTSGLRDGSVDLETGVVDQAASPELQRLPLFEDRLVGVVRAGHPLAARRVTAARYASAGHVGVSRQTVDRGWIDEALAALGLARVVVTTMGGFAAAIAVARGSELVATVPERHTAALRRGMRTFELPLTLPVFTVSMLWHPRMHADPVHAWLRRAVQRAVSGKA
jgi:DNA-binding transcriptional LysR family regulator